MSDTPVFLNQSEFIQPVTLHADLLPDTKRIRNHIIDNPGVTVREMVESIGMPAQQVRNAIFRLNAQGIIRRCKVMPEEKRVRWESGADEEYERRQSEIGQPKQTIVSTWEPELRRDHLTAALFGRGPANRRQD